MYPRRIIHISTFTDLEPGAHTTCRAPLRKILKSNIVVSKTHNSCFGCLSFHLLSLQKKDGLANYTKKKRSCDVSPHRGTKKKREPQKTDHKRQTDRKLKKKHAQHKENATHKKNATRITNTTPKKKRGTKKNTTEERKQT